MATKTVFEVTSMRMVVQVTLLPPLAQVRASGTTRTGGWTNGRLIEIIHVAPPKDGMIELNFVADEPSRRPARTPSRRSKARSSISGWCRRGRRVSA